MKLKITQQFTMFVLCIVLAAIGSIYLVHKHFLSGGACAVEARKHK